MANHSDEPACAARYRRDSDDRQQRDAERHEDVADGTEKRASRGGEDQRTEEGTRRADSDPSQPTPSGQHALQIDDAAGHDASTSLAFAGR